MKVIDLLNKIANGEEVPKKIKYANIIYKATYRPNGDLFQYIDITNDEEYFNYYCVPLRLNDEVEIIEEDKKIEKISNKTRYYFSSISNGMMKTDREALDSMFDTIYARLDELIDEVNKLKDDNK